MKKILYLECTSGISGDMTVAALLDLGADRSVLEKALNSLKVTGYSTEIKRVSKAGLDACDFNVILDNDHENNDHNMEYLHGSHWHEHEHEHEHEHSHEDSHEHEHEHEHSHEDEHGHKHDHNHNHNHNHNHAGHHHDHRHLSDIIDIIDSADITENAAAIAKKIFGIIADAEAKAHGSTPDEVHFHEVGAVDSIVDVVSAAVCADNLKIDEVIVEELCEGRGTVRCQHGIMPVPVPAVVNIAEANGLRLRITDAQGEFVTPTGAAIAAALKTSDKLPSSFKILKTGIGAGKRTYERPSILRAMLIQDTSKGSDNNPDNDSITKLECNIDDCTGEVMGYVMERLFEAGARDVHYFPVFMKKNRPSYQLNVICSPEDTEKISDIIFNETTTIGIRMQNMGRKILKRSFYEVETEFGTIAVKACEAPGGVRYYPEYDSVAEAAKRSGRSFREVFRSAEAQALNRS